MEDTVAVDLIEIQHRIRKVIATHLCVEEARVREDATIAELGGDSLETLAIVSDIENEFNLTIPDAEASTMKSLRAACEVVRRLVNGSHAA